VPNTARYWFPAKRYGWGWGLPVTWQGWLTPMGFYALVAGDFVVFPPRRELFPFLFSLVALSGLLIAVAWLKSEPPRWRWGGE